MSRPGTIAAAVLLALATGLPAWAEGQRQVLQEDGRELEITVSEAYSPAARVTVMDWIQSIAGALRDVYGRWPRQRWAISVSPAAASASDPIPWAQVHRGEVDRVEFFTAPQASAAELKAAWTGYHELAHLLIPYRGWGDAWFNEGLASYYQNLLPARGGLIGEREMWQRLYDGFQRAMADSDFDGQALGAVSEEMRRTGAFMRVYWSGAWYFLAADTRLRLQSGGRQSLDVALAELNACCADAQLSVPEIVRRLDDLNRVILFQTLYHEVGTSTRLPPFEPIFASLGIDVVDGQIKLQQAGPGARLRRQLLQNTAGSPLTAGREVAPGAAYR